MLTQPHTACRLGMKNLRSHERGRTVTRDAAQARVPAPVAAPGQVHVLLIEDDDGDALLVQELLVEASAPVALNRVRSITEAKPLLALAAWVVVGLGLAGAEP